MEKTLLKLVEDIVEKPLELLDYNRPLEEIIAEVDGFIDGFILMARKLVEIHLIQQYQEGVIDATERLNEAVKQEGINYKPVIPDVPDKLECLICMQQRNVEDYALVLRGRLRSSIETRILLDG